MRPPSAASQMYRRQTEAYGQALRTLRRAGRRGDAGAAMNEIKLREQALQGGYLAGGIRRAEEYKAGASGFEQSRELGAKRIEDTINQVPDPVAEAAAQYDDPASAPMSRTVNPNATAGAGRGMPLSRTASPSTMVQPDVSPPLSFEEQDALARERSTQSGAFGRGLIDARNNRINRFLSRTRQTSNIRLA